MRVALPFGRTPENKRPAYRQALAAAEIQPVEEALALAGLDGLLLAGGSDIDPALYGADPDPKTEVPDRGRDRLESALLREALDRDLPVLAICRGLQMLNVVLGGTLVQHIEGHEVPGQPEAHAIGVARNTRLRSILGVEDYLVNSRHHQCVDRLAEGLVVSATSRDGVIEALELPGKRFVLAVQWHPEDRPDTPDAGLFEAFRDAMNPAIATARARKFLGRRD
jgi:putative glutamine amidotransferase